MARKKTSTAADTTKTHVSKTETVSETKHLKPKPSGFKSRNEPYISRIEKRFGEGTRGMLTKADYVPPDIEIAWARAPKEDDGEDLTRRMREGWDIVPADLVTDDLSEAISEGKIAFPRETISNLGSIAQTSGVGLAGQGLVLLARRKEVGENYRKALAERFKRKIRHAEHGEWVKEEQRRVSSSAEAEEFYVNSD